MALCWDAAGKISIAPNTNVTSAYKPPMTPYGHRGKAKLHTEAQLLLNYIFITPFSSMESCEDLPFPESYEDTGFPPYECLQFLPLSFKSSY